MEFRQFNMSAPGLAQRGLMYTYVLPCSWQTPPAHGQLTLRVTFVDGLTGRSFTDQRVVNVIPPTARH